MKTNFLKSGEEKEFTGFYLAAHSFGGYIAGNYALKYHEHIKKLLLLSPIGIKVKAEGEPDLDPMKRFSGRRAAPPKIFKYVGKWAWDKKISPFQSLRVFGRKPTMKVIDKYVTKR